ncbi:MAG: right-handed parallel beta-helix repeat-containing protein [Isosphaeraceae bacterium]
MLDLLTFPGVTMMNPFKKVTRHRRLRDRRASIDLGVERFEERFLLSTFTVTNTLDNPYTGSLRWAVQQADAASSPSIIDFSLGSSPAVITLSLGQLELSNSADSVTIEGPGATQLSISGGGTSRVFFVDSGVTATLSGLTITGGSISGGSGGGLYNDNGTTTLDNCTVSSNTSSGGGGLFNNRYGTTTLDNCTVSSNVADNGGGMYIYYTSTVTLNNSTFSNNTAHSDGGGFYADVGAKAIVTNSIFSDNTATAGGGIALNGTDSSATLTECTISGNSVSGKGGGLYTSGNGSSATLIDTTASGNTASTGGGGLVNMLGTTTLTDSTVSGNSVPTGDGGGVYNDGGTTTLTDSTVSGNSADTSSAGGGVFNDSGTLILTNSTVSGNSSQLDGGGLAFQAGTTDTLTNCTVYGNSAINGGGMYNVGGTATWINCTVSSNTATNGGGLYSRTGNTILGNTIVAGNTGSTGPDVHGSNLTSKGNDLIGKTDGSSGWVSSDLTGSIASPLNPRLGTLTNNGGPTQTMALLAGSPAIDAGANSLAGETVPTSDERGALRGPSGINAGTKVDIGAYEASSSYVVTTTVDSTDVGTLRTAIAWANSSTNTNPANIASPAPNTIDFDISSGPFTIAPTAALPTITQQVLIDGTSQPGYSGTPIVEINGPGNVGSPLPGLTLSTGSEGSTIRGLTIGGFFATGGIEIDSNNNVISGDDIGTDPAGDNLANNVGISITGDGNTIGGTTAAANVIGLNNSYGVDLENPAASNLIEGNLIGTDAAGRNLGNGFDVLVNSGNNTIGGTSAAAANTIGFSTQYGLQITTPSLVEGNFIGTNPSGQDLANTYGIRVYGSDSTIGGSSGGGNVIGFSSQAGVDIEGASILVEGNFIGTNPSGANLGNSIDISVSGIGNTIGGTLAGNASANVIGFSSVGIAIDSSAGEELVEGNFIGTDASGQDLANSEGVDINSSSDNLIGGTVSGAPNTIADNTGPGISVENGSENGIRQNLIYNNTLAIVETGGANNNQGAPTILAVASVPNLTTIDYTVNGILGQTYDLDFFASSTLGGPAAQYVGSTEVFLNSSANQSFTATFNLSTALLSTQAVTATATGQGEDTSPFAATAVTPASPFVVTNTTDNQQGSEVGSLRQAILDANNNPPSSGTDDITFAIPGGGPFTINPSTAFPTIAVPVTLDGTSQSGYAGTPIIEIQGVSSPSVGIDLGSGSDGSTIEGLDLSNFIVAIQVDSYADVISGDIGSGLGEDLIVNGGSSTIGGTIAAAANVFESSSGPGVAINGPRNLLEGNFIGTDAAGDNLGNFIGATLGGVNNTIGGTIAAAANVFGFNTFAAIAVNAAAGSLIEGNFIGTNAAGANLGNAAGVLLDSSGITLGGTVPGAANTIADNTGKAVEVSTGNFGDAIRQNLIYGNGSAIVLDSGANNGQVAPRIVAVASVPNLTTIDYSVTGSVGQTYSVEFFASGTSGSPAAQYLGTTTVTLSSGNQGFTATFDLPTALLSTQAVTATVTDANGNTSSFAATVTPASPFVVTNTSDEVPGQEVGSLRQAILDANDDPPTTGHTDDITFAIPTGPLTITPTVVLPTITVPVTVDGTSQPGVVLDGAGGLFDGLILGTGSNGSTIQGLDIDGFSSGSGLDIESNSNVITGNLIGTDQAHDNLGDSAGILVSGKNNTIGGTTSDGNTIGFSIAAGIRISGSSASSNVVEGNFLGTDPAGDNLANAEGVQVFESASNTIGGTATGAGNTIGFNTIDGIAVLSGANNDVRENTYTGTNGTSTLPSLAANDVGIGPGANNNQPAPTLISASLSGGTLALSLTDNVTNVSNGSTVILDLYALSSSPLQRTFLGSVNSITGVLPQNISIAVSGVSEGGELVATATVAGNGTSAFSAPVTVAAPTVVTNTNDSGPGSLRAAIAGAVSGDTITFDITTGAAPYVIDLASSLSITVPLTIDGTSQPGYANTPIVEIDGGGQSLDGLILTTGSGGSTIKGLDIADFGDSGIHIESSGNLIVGDFVGTSPTVTAAGPGNATGILIDDASGNTIGGTTSAATNVIGFNDSTGIWIEGASGTGNLVEGNLIGTDAAGDNLGNFVGITINSSGNTIGGTTASAANVVGNSPSGEGIYIQGTSANGNLVEGNDFGTNAAGQDLHSDFGVLIDTGSTNTIGGTVASAANVFGFNSKGVGLWGQENLVEGNFIGTDAAGRDLGNTNGVILANNADSNTIGGTIVGAANTIADNTGDGVNVITGTGNAIRQNLIYGNTAAIVADSGSNDNQPPPTILAVASVPNLTTIDFQVVTGSVAGIGNYTIDFFASSGSDGPAAVFLGSWVVDLTQAGTKMDTATFDLSSPLQSSQAVTATVTGPDGSTSPFAAAVTSASPFLVTNTSDQVPGQEVGSLRQAILDASHSTPTGPTFPITFDIPGSAPDVIQLTSSLTISVPVTIDGMSQPGYFPNDRPVIELESVPNQSFDGLILASGSGNSTIDGLDIAGFGGAGIHVESAGNLIEDNLLGTDPTGTAAGPGNAIGIQVDNVSGNTIGGTSPAAANVIGFNTSAGVSITGSAAPGNLVEGNFIGTNASGAHLGNALGIVIGNTAMGNTIGGTITGAANTIAFNTGDAVQVASGSDNAIRQNVIYGNGSAIEVDSGANDNQAPPSIQSVLSVPNLTTIDFQVSTSAAGPGNYTVEFFASNNLGGPAAVFLGSKVVSLSQVGTQSFVETLTLPTALSSTQSVAATVTDFDSSTSPLSSSPVFPGSPYLVTNALDNATVPVIGSLRQAILDANSNPSSSGTDTITFAIPGTGPFVINLSAPLPTINVPVTIDGTSQTGYKPVTPVIEINGNGLPDDGLILGPNSGGSTIEGLDIADFGGAGIHIESSGDLVSGNIIGTDPTETVRGEGNVVGMLIDDVSGNTIGGTTSAAANVLAFNTTAGVSISGTSAADNVVAGNWIGTDPAGDNLGNGSGVVISGSANNTIGGTATDVSLNPVAGNTIGSNTDSGISILSGTGNVARENTYTGVNGTTTLPSSAADDIENATNAPPSPVLVSSSLEGTQLFLSFSDSVANNTLVSLDVYQYQVDANSNPLQRQFLGTVDATVFGGSGNATLTVSGIANKTELLATATVIPTPAAAGNLDSGTSDFSAPISVIPALIVTTNSDALIGTNQTPTPGSLRAAIMNANNNNQAAAIVFDITSGSTVIALSTPLPTINVPITIDGTRQNGYEPGAPIVELDGNATTGYGLSLGPGSGGSTIEGLEIVNFVGAGLQIESSSNQVMNDDFGVKLVGASEVAGPGNNVGIWIDGGANNLIGGSTATANIIGSNTSAGVSISGVAATGNLVAGNFIGTDAGGDNIANLGSGIDILSANNTIGGTAASAANVIGFNSLAGVSISGAAATGNLVAGDFIGTNATDDNRGNTDGVDVGDNASNNTIGGTVAGAGNVIAFNSNDGVDILSGPGNAVRENLIFNNAVTPIVVNMGTNNSPAAPYGLSATSIPYDTSINFSINGTDGATYTIDFFASTDAYGPAADYLGSKNVTLTSGNGSFTATLKDLPFSLSANQEVTATATLATSPTGGGTSALAVPGKVTSPLTVTSLSDYPAGSDSPIPGTLRYALAYANGDTTLDTITFDIPTSSTYTIDLTGPLIITQPVIIDGTLQHGQTIELSGGGSSFDGLILGEGSNRSAIEGLAFVDFDGAGIDVESSNNTIVGNEIGTMVNSATGVGYVSGLGNQTGIVVDGSDNTIGGTTTGAGNTIAYNKGDGVDVDSGTGNTILRNSIFANGGQPIDLNASNQANDDQAPPTISSVSNLGSQWSVSFKLPENPDIAADVDYTVEIFVSSDPGQAQTFIGDIQETYTTTSANFMVQLPVPLAVGQYVTATATFDTTGDTSELSDAVKVTDPLVVNTTADDGSSGSLREVIDYVNLHAPVAKGTTDTISFAIPDTSQFETSGLFVLTLDPSLGALPTINVPVTIDGDTEQNLTQNAIIELDGGGLAGDGLTLGSGSADSTIKNLDIVDFDGAAIDIQSSGNRIIDDNLGVDPTGTLTGTGNATGVMIESPLGNPVSGNTISADTIGFNTVAGVAISGASVMNNLVADNFIGTDSAGDNLANATGVAISNSASDNSISGTNIIGGNTVAGVAISGMTTSGNVVAGNFIGTNPGGSNLGSPEGIVIDDADGNTIGGDVAADANTIDFNQTGVSITGASATGNVVAGNDIGTNSAGAPISGSMSTGNGVGVYIDGGASSNTIGGSTTGAANTIAFNTGPAVDVISGSGNTIRLNLIFGNGDAINEGQDAVGYPTAPDIVAVSSVPDLTTIDYSLTGNAGVYTVDFYASNGSEAPADEYLGSATAVLTSAPGPQSFTAILTTMTSSTVLEDSLLPSSWLGSVPANSPIAAALGSSQSVTATVTVSSGGTSQFASTAASPLTSTSSPISAFDVTNTSDLVPGSAVGSLRVTITNADDTGGGTTNFAIPSTDTGFQGNTYTIDLEDALPPITVPVTIDGASQPGFSANNSVPVIAISGMNLADGLVLGSGSAGSTIEGLQLDQFAGNAIHIESSGDSIMGNLIGTNNNPSNQVGIFVDGADGGGGATIGGTTANGNTIGFSTSAGVSISGSSATGTVVAGNDIGTDANGRNLANDSGIVIDGSSGITIGATGPYDGNIIGFSTSAAVSISGSSGTGIIIDGNDIGTDAAGQDLHNGSGVIVVGSENITIGGTTADGNTIGFSTSAGVSISGSTGASISGSSLTGIVVSGNDIGTDANGGNFANDSGIVIDGSSGITIGATGPYDGNIIGFSSSAAVQISGSSGTGIIIDGNDIGTDDAGQDLHNASGVIVAGSENITIGGTTADGNTIGFSTSAGVSISGSKGASISGSSLTGIVVAGNDIGTNADGRKLANNSGVVIDGSSGITVGGTTADYGNTIGFNTSAGVSISGTSATNNVVANNDIGTDSQDRRLPNGTGVLINGDAAGNQIGGDLNSDPNIISGNSGSGILIEDPGTSGNTVAGNYIGTDSSGQTDGSGQSPIANEFGITITSATNNTIGGSTTTGAGNVISGNTNEGVEIDVGATRNFIVGNKIGTNESGATSIGNAIGIQISSSSYNTIGGTSPDELNLISGNNSIGVQILNSDAMKNLVEGNWIGINASGSATINAPILTDSYNIGVQIDDSPSNTIGGTLGGSGNVISGFGVGIELDGGDAHTNIIQGNQIGANSSAGILPGSIGIGVYLDGAGLDTVGGSTADNAGNDILGYSIYGVYIYGPQSTGNLVQGNTIGPPDINGRLVGIAIQDASSNTIGGTTAAEGNSILGNRYAAVYVFGQNNSASKNVIKKNQLVDNGYGVLLYNATNNGGYTQLLSRNTFVRDHIAKVRIFVGSLTASGASAPSKGNHPKRSHRVVRAVTRAHQEATAPRQEVRVAKGSLLHADVAEIQNPHDLASRNKTDRHSTVPTMTMPRVGVPHGPMAHLATTRLNRPSLAKAHASYATGRNGS